LTGSVAPANAAGGAVGSLGDEIGGGDEAPWVALALAVAAGIAGGDDGGREGGFEQAPTRIAITMPMARDFRIDGRITVD
jgi:hypothetical protein